MVTRGTSYFKLREYFEYMVIADHKSQKYYQLVPKTNYVGKDFLNHWQWREFTDVNDLISGLQTQITDNLTTLTLHIADTIVHLTATEHTQITTLLSSLLPLPTDTTKQYAYKPGTGWVEVTGGGGTDEKVKYDAGDPTAGYVVDKFIAGVGITLSEGTGANVNKLKITNNSTLRPPVIDWYDPSAGLPVAPTVGDRYISDGSGSGWTDGYIYEWDGTTWVEEEPDEGWMVWMLLELIFYVFFSGGWMEAGEFTFVKLDQTIPQTFTGGALVGTGLINVTAGQIGLDTKAYIEAGDIDWATNVPANETDPVFSGSEAANFVAGDKANLDNQSGVNTGDQVGDGVTITGAGTIADPFVAASSGGGHEILDKAGTGLTQRAKLKVFQEVADDAGNDTTKLYPTFKKAGHLSEYDNGNSGASKTIDFNNGQNQKITLTADCTLTLTALSDINASTFRVQLKVIQDGTGEWNLYFPAGTVFCNGAFDFSTGTADQTCLVGIYYDGTKYYIIPTLFFD